MDIIPSRQIYGASELWFLTSSSTLEVEVLCLLCFVLREALRLGYQVADLLTWRGAKFTNLRKALQSSSIQPRCVLYTEGWPKYIELSWPQAFLNEVGSLDKNDKTRWYGGYLKLNDTHWICFVQSTSVSPALCNPQGQIHIPESKKTWS